MERAAVSFCDWFLNKFGKSQLEVAIFCGKGNNGGDGLTIARLLYNAGINVKVFIVNHTENTTADFINNKERLPKEILVTEIYNKNDFNFNLNNSIIIDAILGVGLNKKLNGLIAETVSFLNAINTLKIVIDIPTGLSADQISDGFIFKAHYTFTFQQEKLAFLFPENYPYCGEIIVGDILLQTTFLAKEALPYQIVEQQDIEHFIKPLHPFMHKGSFGHALIVAGSYGKIGAAVLSTRAALHSGCGLVTTYLPQCGIDIMQTAFPEAMVLADNEEEYITKIPVAKKYNTVAIGPGLGTNKKTAKALLQFLESYTENIVLDADALNIIAKNNAVEIIPPNSIITPHPKEFERLFGKTNNSFEQLELLNAKAQQHKVYIVLKGRYTAIATPKGKVFFNKTGNYAMATAGSGDVLTGIIASILAQGYTTEQAAIMGVYIHGKAGDYALQKYNRAFVTAQKIIEGIADVEFCKVW